MDLKGSTLKCAVGRRVTVLYDEGASELVPYAGVVTYAQQSRLYVVFDRFDEADGAWINDADDWSWRDDGSPPPPPPPPVWKPGDMPPPIDKIFLKRLVADDDDEELMNGDEPMMAPAEKLSFFVKWKALAHIHSQWVPRADLELDANNKQRVQRWLKIQVFLISFIFLLFLLFCRFFISFYSAARAVFSPTCRTPPLLHVTYFFFRVQAAALEAGVENTWELGDEADDGGEKEDEEAFNPDFNQVERVIAQDAPKEDLPPRFLVKWRGLPYSSCTWETPSYPPTYPLPPPPLPPCLTPP